MRLARAAVLTAALTGALWGQTATAVSDFIALQSAVAAGGESVITLAGSFDVTAPVTIPTGANVTIESDGEARALTIANVMSGSMFTVSAGAALTLTEGVTLTGKSTNTAPVVSVGSGGTFNMTGGTVTGNSSNNSSGPAGSGGVSVTGDGAFNMYDGAKITGNAYRTPSGAVGTGTGGVMVRDGAVFNMYGGEISNNVNSSTAPGAVSSNNGSGGVYVSNGTFNMWGGAITGNMQTGSLYFATAGGVYLANTSYFNMYGGTITNNSANPPTGTSSGSGDGVYIHTNSTIRFSGDPVIDDGVYLHLTGNSTVAANIAIVGEGLGGGALIVIQGSTRSEQIAPGINITSPFSGLTAQMAKAFVSKDKKLVGRLGGTAANPRVVWADNFDLAIAPAADKDFGTAEYGYGSQEDYPVTITNTGLGQTNELSITLSGPGAGAFTLSAETAANILPDGSAGFTVAPRGGLNAGTYAATVTVAGEYGISVSFNVAFTVTPASFTGTVTIAGWTYGDAANGPVTGGTPDDYAGAVTYTYKARGAADGTYSAAKPVNAGDYTVRAVFLATNNYNEHTAASDFSINKAPLAVTANDLIIKYNDPVPAQGDYSVSYHGLVNNESAAAVLGGTLSFECGYVQGAHAGAYPVTPGGLASNNYDIDFINGALNVIRDEDGCAGSVSVTGWTYGAAPNAPAYSSTNGTAPIIQYKVQGALDGTYSASVPVYPGNYTVRATFPETGDLGECSSEAGFTIAKARLTVMALGTTIGYGEPAPDYGANIYYSGFVNGDNASSLGGGLTVDCGYAQGKDAGEYAVTPGGLSSDNYNIEYWDGVLTVTKIITAINVDVSDKVYDGTAAAVVDTAYVQYRYAGDGEGALFVIPGTAAFADKNAGAGKTVTFSGWSVGGSKAHNYTVASQPVSKTASIEPKPAAVDGNDIFYAGKVYDGTDTVGQNDLSIVLSAASGIISGDGVTAGFASAAFDNKNANRTFITDPEAGEEAEANYETERRTVTVSGITLRGPDAANYSLTSATAEKNAVIEKRNLVIKANNQLVILPERVRRFDYMVIGLVNGESIFGDDNPIGFGVGPDANDGHEYWPLGSSEIVAGVYPVTPDAVADNYNVIPVSGILTISEKEDVSGDITVGVEFDVYDGTRKSVAAGYGGSSDNITYRYTGTSLSGAAYSSETPPTDAGSYIADVKYEDSARIGKAVTSVTIFPRSVTVTVSVKDKVYDGNAAAEAVSAVIAGGVSGDNLTVINGAAEFDDKNAGTGKPVSFSGWSIGGSKAHNYTLSGQPANGAADITPREITLHPDDVYYAGKVYDGTTEVSRGDLTVIVLSAKSGLLADDGAAASFALAAFDNPNAGMRDVAITGATLRGPSAGNYILSSDAVVKNNVEIRKRGLTVKADDKFIEIGGGLPAFTYTVSGLAVVDGVQEVWDVIATAKPSASSYALSPSYYGSGGKYTITIASGSAAADNYDITYQAGTLTVSGKSDISGGIVVDTAGFNESGGGIFAVDPATGAVCSVTVVYDGTPKPVPAFYEGSKENFTYRYSGTTAAGAAYGPSAEAPADAGRYAADITYEDDALIGKITVTLTIEQRPAAVASANHTKAYDGTRNAIGLVETIKLSGIVPSDSDYVTAGSVTAMYTSPDVWTRDIVIYSMTLAGDRSGNYYAAGLPVTVEVAGIVMNLLDAGVSINGWTYGDAYGTPLLIGVPLDYTGEVKILYSGELYDDAGTLYGPTTVRPADAGSYTVNAVFPASDGYAEYTATADFTIAKATIAVGVSIESWTYVPAPNNKPAFSGIPADYPLQSIETVYKVRGVPYNAYMPDVPEDAGDYTVRVLFPETQNYREFTDTADFTIAKAPQDAPYIPGLAVSGNPLGAPSDVPRLGAGIPRIPFDISGLEFEVSGTRIVFAVKKLDLPWTSYKPDISDMGNWQYRLEGDAGWRYDPRFESLTPNNEHIIYISMRETPNYQPSDPVAILVRTSTEGIVSGGYDRVTANMPASGGAVYLNAPASDKFHGIALAKTVATTKAEFSVTAPEKATVNVVIYDNLGNVVFRRQGVRSEENIVWNLTNTTGRGVTGGTYLIVATTKDKSGKGYRYSAKLAVRR